MVGRLKRVLGTEGFIFGRAFVFLLLICLTQLLDMRASAHPKALPFALVTLTVQHQRVCCTLWDLLLLTQRRSITRLAPSHVDDPFGNSRSANTTTSGFHTHHILCGHTSTRSP